MTTLKRLLAVPLLLTISSGLARASEVIDGAGLFSAAAIRQAEATLDRAEKSTGHSVVIETVITLDGRKIDAAALANAKKHPSAALYILIAKKETKYRMEAHTARPTVTQVGEIDEAFINSLKKRDFDGALTNGSDQIASVLASVPAAAKRGGAVPVNRRNAPPGANQGGGNGMKFLLTIGVIVIVVLLAVKLLGALVGRGQAGYGPGAGGPGMRPGMGGGGYGPGYGAGGGGGGFFSSMLGGIGGAMAGNWIYDQFRGRNHGGGYDSGNAASYGNDDSAANDPGWVDAGGGDWGGGDAGGGGDGGADWGGGGGGDWGGGDGGGGGGDWG